MASADEPPSSTPATTWSRVRGEPQALMMGGNGDAPEIILNNLNKLTLIDTTRPTQIPTSIPNKLSVTNITRATVHIACTQFALGPITILPGQTLEREWSPAAVSAIAGHAGLSVRAA